MKFHYVVVSALLACVPSLVSAQTIIIVSAPTKVEFTASVDHAKVFSDGTAVLTGYRLDIVGVNPIGPIAISKDIAKPTPDVVTGCAKPSPCISVVVPELTTNLVKGPSYQATVTAFGPGGTSVGAAFGPFALPGPPAAPGQPVVR
jgi:hypothetical protein